MQRMFTYIAAIAFVLGFTLFILVKCSPPAAAQGLEQVTMALDMRNTERAAPAKTCARLYVFTGLIGSVYSLGVYDEARKIAKAHPCVKVYERGWYQQTKTWATAKANYEIDGLPIFMIGHSMGADAALSIARWLANDRIPVATVFSYDPTRTGAGCVPSNVQTFINWRGIRLGNLGKGNPQPCNDNTKTAMQDYPLNVQHVLIDDLPTVHALTTKHVGEVLHMVEEQKRGKERACAPVYMCNGTPDTNADWCCPERTEFPFSRKLANSSQQTATNPGEKIDMSAARRRSPAQRCSLSPRARGLWSRIKRAFPDARCISGYRPGARMPSGQQSHHATGNAIDWQTRRMAAGVAWSRANAPGMTIVYRSGHIHSDVGGWRGFASR